LAKISITDYFALKGPVPVFGGVGSSSRTQAYLFIGVLLGALSKMVYDAITSEPHSSWGSAFLAVIVSIVIFPQLYYTGGLDKKQLSFAHWTLAFQNGFFWSIAFHQLATKFAGQQ
jgi:hypothetical protein